MPTSSTPKSHGYKSIISRDAMMDTLTKFAVWLAFQNQEPDNVLMEQDEILGELMLEIVKGTQHYADLPLERQTAIVKQMLRNRISELVHRYYGTHRKAIKITMSLTVETSGTVGEEELDVAERIPSEEDTPEELYESNERVLHTRQRLSLQARKVFDALIYGNDQLALLVWLSGVRAQHVFKNGRAVMRNSHIADALLMSDAEVDGAMREIRKAYQEVCNG